MALQEANNRCQKVLLPIVHSNWFRGFMSVAVIGNVIYLGMKVHWEMTSILSNGKVDEKAESVFDTFQLAFLILFTMEIVLRLSAEQIQFCCGPGKYWNIFEVVCLCSMAIDIVNIEELSQIISSVSALRLLRLLRILRAARAVRIFQFMKQLRMMLFSVVSCLVSMMWAVLLLFLFICLFALFLEDSALAHVVEIRKLANQTIPDPKDPIVKSLSDNWNGMLQAIRSLIYSISGGDDWGNLAGPFWTIPPFCGVAYMVFVIMTIFGLLNVLVGIFVSEAGDLTKWDKDFVIDAFIQKRRDQAKEISELFDSIDLDGTGKITFEELSKALQKDDIAAYFQHLEVDILKVEVLFHVLDSNGDGKISKDEFMQGLGKLHGHANATDVADMLIQEQKMNKKLDVLGTVICQRIERLQDGIASKHTPCAR